MATQARLPGTLPTPEQARAKLKNARAGRRVVLDVVTKNRLDLKAIAKEQEAAEVSLEDAEHTMGDAAEGSPEQLAAETEQAEMWDALGRLEKKAANLKAAQVKAQAALEEADRALRVARDDIKAIRQGRRVR
jgi:hypothetical protein